MIRVCSVALGSGEGGIARYVNLLEEGLRGKVEFSHLRLGRLHIRDSFNLFRLVEVIYKAEVVHFQSINIHTLLLAPIAKLVRKRTIATLHGYETITNATIHYGLRLTLFGRLVSWWSLFFMDDVISPSKYLIKLTPPLFRYKCSEIPHGYAASNSVTRSSPITSSVCLAVRALVPKNGIEFLVRAAALVTKELRDASFIIIGDGQERSRLKKLANELGVTGRVHFLGRVSEEVKNRYLKSCAVMVVPSIEESFGLVVLEAYAHMKPVIAFKTGGLPEIVRDGFSGILVDRGNVRRLADAMISLLNDPKRRKTMGLNAYTLISERFSLARMADSTFAVYSKKPSRTVNSVGDDEREIVRRLLGPCRQN